MGGWGAVEKETPGRGRVREEEIGERYAGEREMVRDRTVKFVSTRG
jgi:hypothetical protein